jgi:cobalt-zinc-cadmium efflux system membrane fusion protein
MTSGFTLTFRRLIQRAATSPASRWLQANRIITVPVAVLAALALAFGLGRHSTTTAPALDPAAAVDTDRSNGVPISEQQLQRSGIELFRPDLNSATERPISGFVETAVGARANVGMPVAGRLMRLLVAPGSTVAAGAVIAEVQSPDAAVVRADADAAHATAQSLDHQYRRTLPMARQGALAWQELESRRIASVKASSEARAAKAKLIALGSPDAAGRVMVRSPISGQIAAVNASTGAFLQAGAEVAEIGDARGSELRFLVSPLLGANLRTGQMLRVKAGPRELRARVLAVAPDAGSANRVMVVRAEAVDSALPPAGTAVTAFVMVPSAERRFMVPADAVQMVNGSPVVFRYQRGVAEPIPVVVGEESASRVVIRQGLRGGELLLSGNTASLRAAMEGKRP